MTSGQLWRDGRALDLRPKTLAVLQALMDQPGRVVSQEELRQRVWGRRHGNEAGPKQCIRELRQLLGDSAADPVHVETVGRRGYRLRRPIPLLGAAATAPLRAEICVGRAAEITALARAAAEARQGRRSVALVSGEPGAGKTRLCDTFLAGLDDDAPVWVARGQCIPHEGAREPYGPLIEALQRLLTGEMAATARRALAEAGPSWRPHLPGADRHGATAPRSDGPDPMLREFHALMEALTAQRPGILVIEDLHWADPSTLAWLAAWSLHRGPARLMVLGTYRPDEAGLGALTGTIGHLDRLDGFRALQLAGLDRAAVGDYLAQRFPGHAFPDDLAGALAARTEGHAILVDALADHWVRTGGITADHGGNPGQWRLDQPVAELIARAEPGARGFIANQIARLDPAERALLDRASVAGPRFSAAALADIEEDGRTSNGTGIEEVERQLEHLARQRRFIAPDGPIGWPDGTLASGYAFRHALYREALYAALPVAGRRGLHQRIGARLERGHAGRTDEIAPQLADHFQRAGDWPRAARYRGMAAQEALGRGAGADAAAQFRAALDCQARDPRAVDTPRDALPLLVGLGAAVILSDGFTAPELPDVYARAHDLLRPEDDPGQAVPVLAGLWNYHVSRAEMGRARALAAELSARAGNAPVAMAMAARNAVAMTRFFTGEPRACPPLVDAVLAVEDPAAHADATALFGENPAIVCHQVAACVYQVLGDSARAEDHIATGLHLAGTLDQPFGLAQVLWAGALVARENGQVELMRERAGALIATCEAADIAFWHPAGQMLSGWARAALGDAGGLDELHRGIASFDRMEVRSTLPHGLGLLAETQWRQGDARAGLATLRRALRLSRTTGETWYDAELHRLWAQMAETLDRRDSARRALMRARAIARRQGATAFEARAARALAARGVRA
ncbi:AAA family ATPase [Marinibacterium sp. SX1]|uniref:AAA family ATPase n=1 Tax=Marinibacterium sp. SX1 TaxID=3388424 RepID=UPI003D183CCB